MENAIAGFAAGITPTNVDPALQTSAALTLGDGIVAAGGNRHESNLVALWEFRTGSGNEAFDTSGIDPSITLQMQGSYQWLGGYGLDLTNGYAIANNFDSVKLKTFIESTGEYAIEAWVIPANVTQQNANIVGYSGGTARNFTLGQEMYSYEMYNRIDDPDPQSLNGEPFLTTGDSNQELLQSSLQHVVANYDPLVGRSVYINGQLAEDPAAPGISLDPKAPPTSIGNVVWDDNFAFVLGADVAGLNNWDGQVRMVAIHNRTLTPAQVQQNFDVGVGQKFFLLFWVGNHLGEDPLDPKSFILFEVSQFDSYGYLFDTPRFINLDPSWTPTAPIPLERMRIGINGKEALSGQAYASLETTINSSDYDPLLGMQELSPLGTVIALEKSAAADEFFLTFERIGNDTHVFNDPNPPAPPAPTDPAAPVVSDIGFRTFEEINASIASMTGIPVTNNAVDGVYDDYIQQLPTVEAIDAFLPSHQMAIAQLVLTSCSELVDTNPGYFGSFDFGQNEDVAFDSVSKRNQIINPLLTAVANYNGVENLTSQPAQADLRATFGDMGPVDLVSGNNVVLASYDSLIDHMITNCTASAVTTCDDPSRTRQIVKAVCASAVGGAVTLVQ